MKYTINDDDWVCVIYTDENYSIMDAFFFEKGVTKSELPKDIWENSPMTDWEVIEDD
jgi:hypothetical protein